MFLQQLDDLNPETIHPYLSPNHPNLDALKKSSNCCDKRPSTHHPHHQNHPFPTFYNFGFLKIGLFTICFSPSISSISQHIHPCIPCIPSTKKSGSRSGSRDPEPVGLLWLPPRPWPAAVPVPEPPAASAAPSLGAPPAGCARAPPSDSGSDIQNSRRKCTGEHFCLLSRLDLLTI